MNNASPALFSADPGGENAFTIRLLFFDGVHAMVLETRTQGTDNRVIVYALIIAALALIQYAYSFKNDFVWDANAVFREDPSIREFKYLPHYFTEDMLRHVDYLGAQGSQLKYYRPLTKTLHLLEYQLFGPNPVGYNAVNIILNAVVAVVGFLLICSITGKREAAFLAALLYAVNPARVEAVSWAYSDSYIITALLSLLALFFYHKKRYVLACAGFTLALFCHESAILFPAIILLYEYFLRREHTVRSYGRTLPFFAIAGLFLIIRRSVVGPLPFTDLDPITMFNTIAVVVKRSVKIFFLPDGLVTIYPREVFPGLTMEVVISYFLIFGLVMFGILLWRKKREYLFWYLWFFVWIAVSFNVGRFGEYLMADKSLNLASFGFCTLIALLSLDAGKYVRFAVAAVLCLVLVHAGITFSRTLYWKDNDTYFSKVLQFAPRFRLATHSLARHYASTGRYEQAINLYLQTLESSPDFYPSASDLAELYVSLGRYDQAIAWYRKTIKMNPRYGQADCNLGNVYFLLGNDDQALVEWESAIQKDALNAMPYYNIGMVMEKRGEFADALRYYRTFISLNPEEMPPDLPERLKNVEQKANK